MSITRTFWWRPFWFTHTYSKLKLRVTKLESCLRTVQEDPDQYFQNLNTKNREYVDWKNRNVINEMDKENKSSNEEDPFWIFFNDGGAFS